MEGVPAYGSLAGAPGMPISTVLQGAASLLRCTVALREVSVGNSTTILLLSQEIALSSVNLEQVGQTQCC